MDLNDMIDQLACGAETIASLLRGVTAEQARWRPAPDAWSMIEVINHLDDEEREDFRQRIDLTLHQPDQPWPPIDPQGWVTARAYQQRELQPSLERFLAERQRSIAWLRGLADADWQRARHHPAAGTLHAGDLLAAWAAHDLLHTRQLIELRWGLLAAHAAPYTLDYAGPWQEPG